MANIRKIVKKLIPVKLFRKIEPVGHLVEAIAANIWYGFPSRKMHVIGVTGTNGKTTTTFLIHKMLHNAMFKVGMLSTGGYGIGSDIKPQIGHMTTARAGELHKRLREFKNAGIEWVVLETSSHSLAQHRVWGVPYEIAVITNVTHEHLDYHVTFDNYLQAKRTLFKIAAKHGRKLGIVNADDPNAQKFIDSIPKSVTYGIDAGEIKATNIKQETDFSTYQVEMGDEKYNIRISIPGKFNISNSLAAVTVGRELGLTKGQIERGIAALHGVDGRMMVVDEGQKFKVIVDFACTPDAFQQVLSGLRAVTKGKIVAVFGSPGHRDEAKRPIQGQIAGTYADEVVVTEDDERDVDGGEIIAQIAAGAKKAGMKQDKNLFLIHDREEAINFAISRASQPEDVVIMLGKGHETSIERADGSHPWSDTEVARKALRALKKDAKK